MKKVMGMRRTEMHMNGRGKCCKQIGTGFFGSVNKFLQKTGRTLLGQARTILPVVAKELAPTLITSASAKLAEQATKAGVPDQVVNLGSQLAQRGAQNLQKSATSGSKSLSDDQRKVSNFITDKSADLLGSLLSRAQSKGSGVKNLGQGVKNLGQGVRNLGSGSLYTVESSNLFSPRNP